MSMQALAGLDNFVEQVNSKLAEIPREISISVSGLAAAPVSTSATTQGSRPAGVDAEALAERLYPHIRTRLDQDDRLRGTR